MDCSIGVGLKAMKDPGISRHTGFAENMTVYFIKPVQMESVLTVKPRILDMSRKFVKMDFEVFNRSVLVGKAMMMFQLLER